MLKYQSSRVEKKKVVGILSKNEEMYSYNGTESGAVIEKVKINASDELAKLVGESSRQIAGGCSCN